MFAVSLVIFIGVMTDNKVEPASTTPESSAVSSSWTTAEASSKTPVSSRTVSSKAPSMPESSAVASSEPEEIVSEVEEVVPSEAPVKEEPVTPSKAPATEDPVVPSKAPVKETVSKAEETSATVYISKTGEKYHKKPNCCRMKNGTPISLEEAKKRYEPCDKCY